MDRITRIIFGRKRFRPRSKTNTHALRDRFFGFMAFIRQFPCLICGRLAEAAHTGPHAGWRRADDRTCLPLCRTLHHQHGPESLHKLAQRFWEVHRLDKVALWRKYNGLYLAVDPAFLVLEVMDAR